MIKPNIISLCERKLNKSKINCISLGNTINNKENNEEKDILISSITILELDKAIPAGSTYKLETIIKPLNATKQTLTWESSDTSIATVSSDGTVRGIGEGTCTITARAKDGSGKRAELQVAIREYRNLIISLNSTGITEISFSVGNEYEWLWDSNLNRLISTNKGFDSTISTTTIRISLSNQCTFSFDYGVSSDSYDRLEITLDGYTIISTIYSSTYSVTLAPGTRLLTLKYIKDRSGSSHDDCGYISNMKIKAIPMSVDLGLPSGTKWATFNIGASLPEEYGDYFAWGETSAYGEAPSAYPSSYTKTPNSTYTSQSTKTVYDYAHYKYMTNGSSSWTGCSKYTFADNQTSGCWYSNGTFIGDNKKVLDPEDDAAHVNWGGNWRMPTEDEQRELRSNCYWKWVTSYNGKSVNGYIVYKVKDSADKGKMTHNNSSYSPVGSYSVSDPHIFLPAAGYRSSYSLKFPDSSGWYWASGLTNTSFAYVLDFYPGGVDLCGHYRNIGGSIRPVI